MNQAPYSLFSNKLKRISIFVFVFFSIFTFNFSIVSATNNNHNNPNPLTIVATKIICDNESDLPNWGNGGPDISSITAETFVLNNPNCHLQSGWEFQWSFEGETGKSKAPVLLGDFVGQAVSPSGSSNWNTFGVTGVDGVASTSVSNLSGANKIWVREVLQNGYIPFTFPGSNDDTSAEMYCHKDGLKYDNYDFIYPASLGQTYYCVTWNVLKVPVTPINTPPTIAIVGSTPMTINVGSIFTDPGATAQDLEDGNITANIVASTTLNNLLIGTYAIDYKVTDTGGLSASTTRTVNVITLPVIPPTNTPPVITLTGSNPMTLSIGDLFTDPGATAQDLEDGNITANIVSSSTVNTLIAGTYMVGYSVTDTGGLSAYTTRTVDVVPVVASLPGKITFCMMIADDQNVLATSTYNLPSGTFSVDLATSTDFSSYIVGSKMFNSGTFTPNTKIILPVDLDSECVTFNNLALNTYYYSQEAIVGSLWNTPKYNDQFNQPVNNVFDFFVYSPELFTATTSDDSLRQMNSDGQIVLSTGNNERTVFILNKYNPAPTCTSNCGGGNTPSANLSVIKTADKTSANVGDTVTYTITVVNNGPDIANGVTVGEVIPSGLSFVSSSSTLGSFSTTTSLWTIGTLNNASSTTLTVVVTINSGTEGQKITNIVTVSGNDNDPSSTDNTSNIDVNVNTPVVTPPPTCASNCGGGGGGGGGNGPIVGSIPNIPPTNTTVSPVQNSCYYLFDYLRKDFNNNPVEVRKLQVFLRDLEGFKNVQITGIYDDQTIVALDAFQERYATDILTPWGHTKATSYTYILTKKKVNEIYCKTFFPVTAGEQSEINNYKNLTPNVSSTEIGSTSGTIPNNTVGIINTPKKAEVNLVNETNGGLTTLAGISTTTKDITSAFTANVISSGKKLGNLLSAFMFWPLGDAIKACESVLGYNFSRILNIILIIIIATISYFWYREYKNNKKLDDINKEIDLS